MRLYFILALTLIASGCIGAGSGNGGNEVGEATTSTTLKPVLPVEQSGEVKSCGDITGNETSRNICFYQEALNSKEREHCEEITVESLRSRCRAELDRDPVKCGRISELSDKDWCLRNVAFKLNEIDYCYDITLRDIRDECISSYLEYKKPDPFKCYDIKNQVLRDDCILNHVGLGRIDPTLCFTIQDGGLERECNETYLGDA